MKRKITLLLLCLTLCIGASSAGDSGVLWGVKGKVNLELPGKWKGDNGSVKMYKHGFGVDLGAVCNIYLDKGFYFEPGLGFFYEGYNYDGLAAPDESGTVIDKDPKITMFGVRLPLVVGYTYDISDRLGVSIFTGPQLGYAFSMKTHTKHPELWGDLTEMNEQRRFDCAWKVGLGFPIDSYMLSLEADFGLTDMLKGDLSFRENRLGLAFTYYF